MAVSWSEVFTRSRMAAGVFGVRAAHRQAVRDWVTHQDVPSVVSRGVYEPTVYGWAVLDGGITEIHQYGLSSLPTGIRVVGWQTLRLLVDELGLAGPRRVLPGEVAIEIEELRLRHLADTARDGAAHQRAELLASCADGDTMRWVAHDLLGDATLGAGSGARPAAGAWGEQRFSRDAAALLAAGGMEPAPARELALRMRPRFGDQDPALVGLDDRAQLVGIGVEDAHRVLAVLRFDRRTVVEYLDTGMHPNAVIRSLEAGVDLPTAREWMGLGARNHGVHEAVTAGLSFDAVRAHRDLGVPYHRAVLLEQRGVTPVDVRERAAALGDLERAVQELILARPQAARHGKGELAGHPVGPWLSERNVEQQLAARRAAQAGTPSPVPPPD